MKQNGKGRACRGLLEEGGNFYTFYLEHQWGKDFLDDIVVDVKTTVN
jgi:hypothetical protein